MKPLLDSVLYESPALGPDSATATVILQRHAVCPIMAGTAEFLYFHGDAQVSHLAAAAAANLAHVLLSSVDRSTTKLPYFGTVHSSWQQLLPASAELAHMPRSVGDRSQVAPPHQCCMHPQSYCRPMFG